MSMITRPSTLLEIILDYLETINLMAETPGAYHLDKKRADLHDEILEKLRKEFKCDDARLKAILHNLEIAIDFKPPLERYDSIKVYARDLERFLTWYAISKMFLKKTLSKITTEYGVIEA